MITNKHRFENRYSACTAFRTVMSPGFVSDLASNLEYAANSGSAFYSNKHSNKHSAYCVVMAFPSGVASAIPSGSTALAYSVNVLTIADAYGSAHPYGEKAPWVSNKIRSGDYQGLPICSVSGCDNLCLVGENRCVKHKTPPLAK